MNLSKEEARVIAEELDRNIKECMDEREVLKVIREERECLTRKERVAKAIMAYFKLISIPTITSICFLVLILTKQEEPITILEAFKAMLAAFALNVGINYYVKARVKRLINLI